MELIGEFHKAEKNISAVEVSNSSRATNLALQRCATSRFRPLPFSILDGHDSTPVLSGRNELRVVWITGSGKNPHMLVSVSGCSEAGGVVLGCGADPSRPNSASRH
jgi:hypothetical protein